MPASARVTSAPTLHTGPDALRVRAGFAAMCVGMFIAILDVQIVATSLPNILAALTIRADDCRTGADLLALCALECADAAAIRPAAALNRRDPNLHQFGGQFCRAGLGAVI